jgi:hypothetical protein
MLDPPLPPAFASRVSPTFDRRRPLPLDVTLPLDLRRPGWLDPAPALGSLRRSTFVSRGSPALDLRPLASRDSARGLGSLRRSTFVSRGWLALDVRRRSPVGPVSPLDLRRSVPVS